MPADRITVYVPDNSLRKGYLSLFVDIARELVDSRWLTYQLFKRDALAFYKQSLLGALWLVLLPLFTVGTFVVLRGSGVLAAGELEAPYPIYAGLGLAIWQLFAQGLVAGAGALVGGGDMISRINFSKKSLVIGAMGRSLVSFAVLLVLVVVLFVVYVSRGFVYHPGWGAALFPVLLLPIALFTVGFSFFMALVNGIMRDVANMLSMFLTFLMLLTPVLYEKPPAASDGTAGLLSSVTAYNPLYYLVTVPRDFALLGRSPELAGFAWSSLLALGVFLFALLGFHLTETRIAERV